MESINEALVECVKALGGSKKVGPDIFPDLAPDAAQRKLLDCLNDDRPQQLNPAQAVLILRKAREIGCHIGMQFLADHLSYADPVPIEPLDELAELLRLNLEAHRESQRRQDRIEQLLQPALHGRAA